MGASFPSQGNANMDYAFSAFPPSTMKKRHRRRGRGCGQISARPVSSLQHWSARFVATRLLTLMGWAGDGPEDYILDSFVPKLNTQGLGYTIEQRTSVLGELPTMIGANKLAACDDMIPLD
jgi:hypothetical protein